MITLLILWVTSFGLGSWLMLLVRLESSSEKQLQSPSWLGLRFYGGFLLLPILLLCGNMGFQIPLGLLSQLLFGFSSVGAIYGVWKIVSFSQRRGEFIHPVFILPLALALVTFWSGGAVYVAKEWDEFANWLLMPKQMLLFDRLSHPNFLDPAYLKYTPGWPSILAYLNAALGKSREYSEATLIYAPAISSLGLMGLIFDTTVSMRPFGRVGSGLLQGWLLMVAFFLILPFDPFPQSLLIEPLQLHNFVAIPFAILLICEKSPSRRLAFLFFALILAGGFLLKQAIYTILPSAALAIGMISWWGKNSESSLSMRLLRVTQDLIVSFALFVAIFIFWSILTRHYHGGHTILPGNFKATLLQHLQERPHLLAKMLGSDNSELIDLIWNISPLGKVWHAISALGILVALFSRRYRWASVVSLGFVATYFTALYWMFLMSFSVYEADLVSGLFRFMIPPVYYLRILGPWLFFAVLGENALPALSAHIPAIRVAAWFLPFLAFFTAGLEIHHAHRIYDLQIGKMSPSSLTKEVNALVDLIHVQGWKRQSRVYIIAQGGDAREYFMARYVSLKSDRLEFLIASTVTSWGVKKENIWMSQISPSQLSSDFQKADALWVVKSDLFMHRILQQVVNGGKCPGPFEKYFLVKSSKDGTRFDCVSKTERLRASSV